MAVRRFFVGGNWKMNGNLKSISALLSEFQHASVPKNVDVVVCPPFTYLDFTKQKLRSDWQVCAQNVHSEESGAFTGEVSSAMLRDLNVSWTLLGHSERRQFFGDTDEVLIKKVSHATSKDLNVIYCIGESLAERKAGSTMKVVEDQLKALSKGVPSPADWSKLVIAYEPVWAIGTGLTASPQQAQEVHFSVRKWVESNVATSVASTLRIIYGGSVKSNNADELASQPDIDGFLVGGASLIGADFVKIVNSAMKK